jgi:DNA-binding NarL/FixJ family response regulator
MFKQVNTESGFMPNREFKDRSQLVPYPGASDLHFRIARSFALIGDLYSALMGHYDLDDVIAHMTRQVDARNLALFRISDGQVHPIGAAARAFDDYPVEQSSGNLARYLQRHNPEALIPGSILFLSDIRGNPTFETSAVAAEWAKRVDIIEVALIVLETTPSHMDLVEVIFDMPPDIHPDLPPLLLIQALADAWSQRPAGFVARLIKPVSRVRANESYGGAGDILSPDNPCGLSRAEQRVCQLLARGEKARDIAEALSLTVSTVRSHLRNIYAKTETSGQVELISVINERKGLRR